MGGFSNTPGTLVKTQDETTSRDMVKLLEIYFIFIVIQPWLRNFFLKKFNQQLIS